MDLKGSDVSVTDRKFDVNLWRGIIVLVGCLLAATLLAAASANAAGEDRTASASKTSGLDADGETVTVTGSGFDPNKGIYVALCVDKGPGELSTPCLGGVDMSGEAGTSAWVSSNPPSYGEGLAQPYGPDGSFTVSLHVAAADEFVDCRDPQQAPDGCIIYVRADHTRTTDRSQDFRIPVTFGGAGDGGAGGGSGGGEGGDGDGNGGSGNGDDGGSLAQTGTSVLAVAGIGVLLCGLGLGVVLMARRRKASRGAVILACGGLLLGALAGPGTPSAEAAAREVADGDLEWGVKASLRAHVESVIADGGADVTAPATAGDDTYTFPTTGDAGSYDADARTGEIAFAGAVRFTGHDLGDGPMLELEIENPRIVIDGSSGTLVADVTGRGYDGDPSSRGELVEHPDVELATLDLAGTDLAPDDHGVVTAEAVPVTLTADGARALAGYYEPGASLDPISLSLATPQAGPDSAETTPDSSAVTAIPSAAENAADGPQLTVANAEDIGDGADVTVTGSGFTPGRPVFVAVTADDEPGAANPSPFAHSKRVVPDADGTFGTTLENVRARFTNEDADVNCGNADCYVAAFSSPLDSDNRLADRRGDRSQDDFVPVEFAGR